MNQHTKSGIDNKQQYESIESVSIRIDREAAVGFYFNYRVTMKLHTVSRSSIPKSEIGCARNLKKALRQATLINR